MGLSKLSAAAVAAVALACASSASATQVLYDNGPPNGNLGAYGIQDGEETSNSFTLSQTSKITGVTFGAWTLEEFGGSTAEYSEPITSVDWGISTSPFADDGTATPTETDLGFPQGNPTYALHSETISFAPVTLGPGVYYLTLSNAVATSLYNGDFAAWDQTNGPSTAFLRLPDGTTVIPLVGGIEGSESFQILGTAVPEPATWAMVVLGLLGAGAMLRRRKRLGAEAFAGLIDRN